VFTISLGRLPEVIGNAAAAAPPVQGDPSAVGQWSGVIWTGFIPIHVHLLPNGKVLMWGRDTFFECDENFFCQEFDANDYSQSYVFDPATNNFVAFPFNSTTNLFCSGHCFLPDGRLFVTGGHQFDDGFGEVDTNFYDSNANAYSLGPPMQSGRWYPTACALGNGETLVVSGFVVPGQVNSVPQVLQTNQTWRPLSSVNDSTPLYPRLLLAPNSRVFIAAERPNTQYLATSGSGSLQDMGNTGAGTRDYGSAVMYDDGKVLIMGGGAPTATAQIINLQSEAPAWSPLSGNGSIAPMLFPRRQLNATILADGKVLVTGGVSSGSGLGASDPPVFAAEMWNPSTRTWSTMASAARPRKYHSTAVLLPDGRVLTGGGGGLHPPNHTIDEPSMEIYSPPYLFNGARPTIASAPATANHGQQIFVGTPDATSISKVTLVRLSSVTHAFNQNQRVNILSFRQAPGGLNVTVPGSGHLCPPGHYMMFLIKNTGVPSVASIIQVTVPTGNSNAINDQRYFTAQQYLDQLGREADSGGLAFWTNQITQCGNDAVCIDGKRVNVARAFWEAGEFQNPLKAQNHPLFFPTPPPGEEYNRQPFVEMNYSIYLRRPGANDPGGVAFWTNSLTNCINNNPSNISGCYDNIIKAFLLSGEYLNRFYKP